MHRISFNVGNEYFSHVTRSRNVQSPDAQLKMSLQFTHLSFDDEEHLKREFQRIREKRKEIMETEDHQGLTDIEREWAIIKTIKDTYWKVWQKSDEEIDSISRRFVFHVEGQCYAFDLYSPDSDLTGHNSTRFWFNDRKDLEVEWTRIREKTIRKLPGISSTKHIRFLEPEWDLEWSIIDGIMKTYLWAEGKERETETESSGTEDTVSSIEEVHEDLEKLNTDFCKMKCDEEVKTDEPDKYSSQMQ